jgi:hypothetical protein
LTCCLKFTRVRFIEISQAGQASLNIFTPGAQTTQRSAGFSAVFLFIDRNDEMIYLVDPSIRRSPSSHQIEREREREEVGNERLQLTYDLQ